MRKKLFKPIQIGGATALISITSLLSYAIGLFRDRIIAINFGTSAATDTYNASFLIPDLLFNLFIAGALTAAFLPMFSEYLTKDKKEAAQLANTMLTSATLLISTLAIIAFFTMPILTPILFPEADPTALEDITKMTKLMLPSAVLFAISNTIGNILMSYKHFLAYALSPILYNLGIILGITFLEDRLGIYAAATGVLIGAALHCAIRIIDLLGTPYSYKPQLKISDPGFKKILKLMVPKSLSLLAWQANLYVFAVVGMQIIEGGLGAFHFARNLQSFAVSLFGIAFATAVFPHIANAASNRDFKKYTHHIQKTTQRILFFTIPAAVGMMLMSREIIDLILSGGEFNTESTELTALLLFFFAISIPFESLTHIFARAFYALKNTITPMIINISSMVIMAAITIYMAPKYGIQWFSIAFSTGFAFYILAVTLALRKKLTNFNTPEFLTSLSKTLIASGLMAIIILLSLPLENSIPSKLSHLIRLAIGASTFFIFAIILKSPEINSVKYIANRIFKK